MSTFTDPAVRCVDCQRLVLREEIRNLGMCPGCGTKRFKNILLMTDKEIDKLKIKGVGDEFFKKFEPTGGQDE